MSVDWENQKVVAVDWENQKVVAVDIAEVSHGEDEGFENGFLPVWNTWFTNGDGDDDPIAFRTNVTNRVDVEVMNRVSLNEPVGVDVWNWP